MTRVYQGHLYDDELTFLKELGQAYARAYGLVNTQHDVARLNQLLSQFELYDDDEDDDGEADKQ